MLTDRGAVGFTGLMSRHWQDLTRMGTRANAGKCLRLPALTESSPETVAFTRDTIAMRTQVAL